MDCGRAVEVQQLPTTANSLRLSDPSHGGRWHPRLVSTQLTDRDSDRCPACGGVAFSRFAASLHSLSKPFLIPLAGSDGLFNPYAIGVGEMVERLPRTPMALRLNISLMAACGICAYAAVAAKCATSKSVSEGELSKRRRLCDRRFVKCSPSFTLRVGVGFRSRMPSTIGTPQDCPCYVLVAVRPAD